MWSEWRERIDVVLQYPCQFCGAAAGEPCHTRTSWNVIPFPVDWHVVRVRAAGMESGDLGWDFNRPTAPLAPSAASTAALKAAYDEFFAGEDAEANTEHVLRILRGGKE
jgi:hypothetical protein